MPKDHVKPYHWFTSSAANWNADNDLAECLKRQTKADSKIRSAKLPIAVYRVPGEEKDSVYDIRNYRPVVEGVEFVGYVNLKDLE